MQNPDIIISGMEQKIDFQNIDNIPHISGLLALSKKVGKNIETDNLVIVKYNNSKYVLEYEGKKIGRCDENEFLNMKNKLSKLSAANIHIQYARAQASNLQNLVEASPGNPKTEAGWAFVTAHLGTYKLQTLLGMYDSKTINKTQKKEVLNAISANIALKKTSEQIAFLQTLNKTKNKELYYETVITILRNIESDDKSTEIVNTLGAENIKTAVKEYIMIDHNFATTFGQNYNSKPKVRGYTTETFQNAKFANNEMQDAGEVLVAYVMSMQTHGGVKNISSTSRAIYQAFGSDLIHFKKDFLPIMNQYAKINNGTPDNQLLQTISQHGLIGGLDIFVDKALSKTNMTEGQKNGRKTVGTVGAVIALVYGIFKGIKKLGWKGLATLLGIGVVGELASESMTGKSLFDMGGKLLFGSGESALPISDQVRKTFKNSKEVVSNNEKLKENFGYPSFANMLLGDAKLTDLQGFVKFQNGNTKFDSQKYIKSLPDGDRRKAFLENMGSKTADEIFSQAFMKLGITNQSQFNKNSSKTFNSVVSEYLSTQKTTNHAGSANLIGTFLGINKAHSMPIDPNQTNNINPNFTNNVDNKVTTPVDAAQIEDYQNAILQAKTRSNVETAEKEQDLAQGEVTFTENASYTLLEKKGSTMNFGTPTGEILQINIPNLEKERILLSPTGKQRHNLLNDVVDVWFYNAYKESQDAMFTRKSTRNYMRQSADEIQQLFSSADNNIFEDKAKFDKFVNTIFEKILATEEKEGIIGEGDMLEVKEKILHLQVDTKHDTYRKNEGKSSDKSQVFGEFSIGEGEYGKQVREIFEIMRRKIANQGDSTIIREKLADKIINSSEFSFISQLETKVLEYDKFLNEEDVDSIVESTINIEILAKATGLDKDKYLDKLKAIKKNIKEKLKKTINEINEQMWVSSQGEKSVKDGYAQLSKEQQQKISYDDWKKMQIKATFSRMMKHIVLRECLDKSDVRGFTEYSYRGQYASVTGLASIQGGERRPADLYHIDDANISISEEIAITVATSLIPGGLAFAGAKRGLTAIKLGSLAQKTNKVVSLSAKGTILAGASTAGYLGTELLPSLNQSMKDGELTRTGSKEKYAEFMVLSAILATYAPLKNLITNKVGTFTLKGLPLHASNFALASEASVNALRMMEDKEFTLNPANWSMEEIITVVMIATMHFAGNKGGEKINASKENGKLKVDISGDKTKVNFSAENGQIQHAKLNGSGNNGGKQTFKRNSNGESIIETNHKTQDGKKVTETSTIKPDGDQIIEIKVGSKVTETSTIKPDGEQVITKKYQTQDGKKVTETSTIKPDGEQVIEIKVGSKITETSTFKLTGDIVITRDYTNKLFQKVTETSTFKPNGEQVIEIKVGTKVTETYEIPANARNTGAIDSNIRHFKYKHNGKDMRFFEETTINANGAKTTRLEDLIHKKAKVKDFEILRAIKNNQENSKNNHIKTVDDNLNIAINSENIVTKHKNIMNTIENIEANFEINKHFKVFLENKLTNSSNLNPVELPDGTKIWKTHTGEYELLKNGATSSNIYSNFDDILKQVSINKLDYLRVNQTEFLESQILNKLFTTKTGNEYQIIKNSKGKYQWQMMKNGAWEDIKYHKIAAADKKFINKNLFSDDVKSVLKSSYADKPSYVGEHGPVANTLFNNELLGLKSSMKNASASENAKKLAWFVLSGNPSGFSGGTVSKMGTLTGLALLPGALAYNVYSDFKENDVKTWQEYGLQYSTDLGVYGILNRFIGALYLLNELDDASSNQTISPKVNDMLNQICENLGISSILPDQDSIDMLKEIPGIGPKFAPAIERFLKEKERTSAGNI